MAANAGDIDGVVAVYASDASRLPPNSPVRQGSEAIRGLWGGCMEAYTLDLELRSDEVEGQAIRGTS